MSHLVELKARRIKETKFTQNNVRLQHEYANLQTYLRSPDSLVDKISPHTTTYRGPELGLIAILALATSSTSSNSSLWEDVSQDVSLGEKSLALETSRPGALQDHIIHGTYNLLEILYAKI